MDKNHEIQGQIAPWWTVLFQFTPLMIQLIQEMVLANRRVRPSNGVSLIRTDEGEFLLVKPRPVGDPKETIEG